ncbi:MAG: AraC family transcriptional regulator [Xanthomonadales bacterium]|nr:AraC family transcriptional regulator [Xanthomonadales bacterium]
MKQRTDPNFHPKQSVDYVLTSRPVVGLKDEYPAGYVDQEHSHNRAQLLYAVSGVMSVVTRHSTYAVPPQRALWMAAGVSHEVFCRSNVSLRTLYIDAPARKAEYADCRLIEVSDFLQALIIEIVSFDIRKSISERERVIVSLLLNEIWSMPRAPYHVRMPRNEKLCRACQIITEDPANHSSLDDLAEVACISRRTFTRLFRQETGMSFAAWRQQMRLMEALSLMGSGRSITTTAYEVGYNSPSAFTAAFHRTFGLSPSQHRSR